MREVKLTLTVNVEEFVEPEDVAQDIRRLLETRPEDAQSTLEIADVAVAKQPRVLVCVSNGAADHVIDGDVAVQIFDQDVYEEDPELEALPSERFADLAHQLGISMKAPQSRVSLSDLLSLLRSK